MADEAPAEGAPAEAAPPAEEGAPAPAPAEAPPAAPEPAAAEHTPEHGGEQAAPEHAEHAAAPPGEPAHEPAKEAEPGAPQPAPATPDAAAPPDEASHHPAEARAEGTHEGAHEKAHEGALEGVPPTNAAPSAPAEEATRLSSLKKGDSMVRTSSVSFNKPVDPTSQSLLEPRRSSLYPGRPSRPSKELGRRSTRQNYFSMMSIKRGSLASFQERAKTPKYMNSYKLESERPFNADKVYGILVQILTETIEDTMMYDPETCTAKAKHVSGLIRAKVKEQDYDRYKLVCLVTIGEKKSHDIFTGVRFLWDEERDKYATYMHENMYLFATASVFGLYYE